MLSNGESQEFGDYVVDVENNTHGMIIRKDGQPPQPTFYELQYMKDIMFGNDQVAIEVFPTGQDLMDGSNIRHLWLMDRDSVPNLRNHHEKEK